MIMLALPARIKPVPARTHTTPALPFILAVTRLKTPDMTPAVPARTLNSASVTTECYGVSAVALRVNAHIGSKYP